MTRLKIGTLMGPFNPKYELKYELKRKSMSLKFTELKKKKKYELKIYRRVICHDNED